MWFTKMDDAPYHLSQLSEYLPAVLVTIGLAVLIGVCGQLRVLPV